MHEVMCTQDDTVWKFKDYYLIVPIDADKNKYRKKNLKRLENRLVKNLSIAQEQIKHFYHISDKKTK